jgi:hypothetical protein
MKIVGCDLHARQQTLAMVDTETGEFTERTLFHEGNAVREFYAAHHRNEVVTFSKPTSAYALPGNVVLELTKTKSPSPLTRPTSLEMLKYRHFTHFETRGLGVNSLSSSDRLP